MNAVKIFIFLISGTVILAIGLAVGLIVSPSFDKQTKDVVFVNRRENPEDNQIVGEIKDRIKEADDSRNLDAVEGCPAIVMPAGYKIASGKDIFGPDKLLSSGSKPLVFQIDLDADGENEDVRVLVEALVQKDKFSFQRRKPVVVEVLKNKNGCLRKVFSFNGREGVETDASGFGWRNGNEILSVYAFADFWGDGKDVFVFVPTSTNYGSGYTAYVNLLAFVNGRYTIIEGPVLNELSNFRFSAGASPGNTIWIASGIWEEDEAHFDPHRCRVEKWSWQKSRLSYERLEIGTTKNKYEKCRVEDIIGVENMLQI